MLGEEAKRSKPFSSAPLVTFHTGEDPGKAYLVEYWQHYNGEESESVVTSPGSFIVTTAAYQEFMNKNRIYEVVEGLLFRVDVKDLAALEDSAAQIKQVICSASLPPQTESQLQEAYLNLRERNAIAWPLFGRSMMSGDGHQNYRYLSSFTTLIDALKDFWTMLFEPVEIFYRELNGLRHQDTKIVVTIQRI